MNRSQLEYILTLAKLKNFGLAAEACYISQSTLSAMIAKYEQQIGLEIFNRKTRPISITPNGEQIIQSLKNINREYQLLDETVNEVKGFEIGHLSIACIPTVAHYLYPLILQTLSDTYPKVDFVIHELTTEQIVNQIKVGDIDIGIVSTPLEDGELLEYDLYDEEFLVYDCSKSPKSKQYTVSDIDIERLWLMEEGHCLRNQVGKICELRQQQQVQRNLTYNCGSIYTLVEMVKINRGITLLPSMVLATNKHFDQSNVYHLVDPTPVRKIGIITHKRFLKTRILKQLSQIIQDRVNSYLPKSSHAKMTLKPF